MKGEKMRKLFRFSRVLQLSCGIALTLCALGPTPAFADPGFSSTPIPDLLDFGQGSVGTTNKFGFWVSSVGDSTLILSSPWLGGANPEVFSLSTAFPISMNEGAIAYIRLSCTPPTVGTFTATFNLSTNDPYYPWVYYRLRCTGVEGDDHASFSSTLEPPGPLSFGRGPVGVSNTQRLWVFEKGTMDLIIQPPILGGQDPGAFNVAASFPAQIVEGGPPMQIALTCTPSLGENLATLDLITNDPDNPLVSFNLSCTGYDGLIVRTAGFSSTPSPPGPISLDPAPPEVNVSRLIQVNEVGSGDLVLLSHSIGGADPQHFIVSTQFPLTIPEGSTFGKTILVDCIVLEPTPRTAELQLTTNDLTQPTVSYTLFCGMLFGDGFESGDTQAWSATVGN
jgi:hypothetical protein